MNRRARTINNDRIIPNWRLNLGAQHGQRKFTANV